jgi:hypothetical protein
MVTGNNYYIQASSEWGRELLAAMERVVEEFASDPPDTDYQYDLDQVKGAE